MPAVSSPPASHLPSKKKKPTPLAVVQAVAQAAQAATAAATAVAQTSPSYVAPTSSSSSSSTSTTSAPTKAPPSLAKEFIKDSKKPKTVSGKYAKASEKAQAKRAKQSAQVKRKTAEVTKKYMKTPKFGPGNAYTVWEGSNKIASKARELSPARSPKKATGGRQKPSTGLSAPKPRKVATRLEKAVGKSGVTNPSLGPDQTAFVNELAKRTGLSPAVLAGMAASEQPADSPSVPGSQNWLNIGYFDSGPGAPTQDKRFFSTPERAAKTTANFLKGKTLGASEGIQNILSTAGKSDAAQIKAIQTSGWASSGHPNLPELAAQSTPTKSVPPKLKRTARQTLGKKPTKAILKGGTVVKDPKAGEKTKGAPSYKETKQYIVPTEAKSEIRSEQRAPARTMVTGMDPALQSALVQLAKNTGIPVRINEGYRTAARANDFPSGTASQHHQGNAADIDNNADYSAEDLAKVGLNNTAVGGEPWHFQLNDPDSTASVVNTNIPIKGTKLAVKVPVTSTGSGAVSTGGVSSPVGSPVSAGTSAAQVTAELKRKGVRSPSLRKRLAKIDHWLTTPLTAETPEISQELIDRILGK